MERNVEAIDSWHRLFDTLCEAKGFSDNMSLAARYCEMTSGRGQKQFDTAVRNLNNWRSGRHLPRPRSMRVLARVLGLEEDAAMMAHWDALYDLARKATDEPGAESPDDDAQNDARLGKGMACGQRALTVLSGVALFSLGVLAGRLCDSEWRPWRTETDSAPLISYQPEVRLVVGQSRIIHGERGDCGRLPRDWRDVWGNLPTSRIGEFSDAGIVRRNSMFCKGVTPARGIRFTATAPGTEEMYVTGDYMKVTVVDEASLTVVTPKAGGMEQ